uniref:Uncharacterized protein n=1 Tax=Rhizophora mucronata TaxID=61149 RepID=A0A2P2QB08_RHIMU
MIHFLAEGNHSFLCTREISCLIHSIIHTRQG